MAHGPGSRVSGRSLQTQMTDLAKVNELLADMQHTVRSLRVEDPNDHV